MAICHDARKGRHSGSHWSKPARLRSTRPVHPRAPIECALPGRPNLRGNGPCQSYNRLQRIGCSPPGGRGGQGAKALLQMRGRGVPRIRSRVWGPTTARNGPTRHATTPHIPAA
jgi:hypothetical protein